MPHDSALLKPEAGVFVPFPLLFHPAWKIAGAFCFAVCVSLLSRQDVAGFACCIPVLGAAAGRLSFRTLGRRLLTVNVFFVFLWLFLPMNLSSGSFSWSRSGAELAALITLKGNAIAAMLLALLGTSTVSESCRGLLKLRLPEKFVTLLLLTYANLAHMMEEYAKISAAARLRGFYPGKTPAGYKAIASLVAMLLVRSWQRSQRVGKAMRLRGFSGQYPLLELPPAIPYRNYGALFLAGICAVSAALILADLLL